MSGNRGLRRFTKAALAAGLIGAIIAAVLLTRWLTLSGPSSAVGSSNSSPPPSAAESGGSVTYLEGPKTDKLAYGMTTQQVRQIDGRPARIVRYQGLTCWQYDVNLMTPAVGQFRASTLNAVRVCFYGGLYAVNHLETDGKWDAAPMTTAP